MAHTSLQSCRRSERGRIASIRERVWPPALGCPIFLRSPICPRDEGPGIVVTCTVSTTARDHRCAPHRLPAVPSTVQSPDRERIPVRLNIACVAQEIPAFLRAESPDNATDSAQQARDCVLGCLAQRSLEFAKGHLDGVEIGRIGGR